ncbi:selenium-dependent xanthine dehydrogenase [Sesbania bispinosa]|nr:selenium-dependent xanthine dehydrogenase [Sesbania bispinosa]
MAATSGSGDGAPGLGMQQVYIAREGWIDQYSSSGYYYGWNSMGRNNHAVAMAAENERGGGEPR